MTKPQSVLAFVSVAVFSFGIGFATRWIGRPQVTTSQACLRLGGYTYIKPLLACDTTSPKNSSNLEAVQRDVKQVVTKAQESGRILTASVYVRDLVSLEETTVNPDETFFPASLKKVPLMMQLYKESETDPSLLDRRITISDSTDYNAGTTIVPRVFPEFGKTYTNAELIDFMIRYSDNTSFQYLLNEIGVERFNQPYTDLELHYPDTVVKIDDYLTPYSFSLFFRTLFNATYLNREKSEAALKLLTESDYRQGIVAGVPDALPVAHKFGMGVVPKANGEKQGELHDCGIIYMPENPYLLCVMTKSVSADYKPVEQVLADVSRTVYAHAAKGFDS